MLTIPAKDLPMWAKPLELIPLPDNAWIAGGAIHCLCIDKPVKDYDVFGIDPEAIMKFYNTQLGEPVHENEQIANFKYKDIVIQVIKNHRYDNVLHNLQDFDFTIVKAAWNGEALILNSRFYQDAAAKELVFDRNPPRPMDAMLRAFKYVSRGYHISPRTMAIIAQGVQKTKVDWNKPLQNSFEYYNNGTPREIGF